MGNKALEKDGVEVTFHCLSKLVFSGPRTGSDGPPLRNEECFIKQLTSSTCWGLLFCRKAQRYCYVYFWRRNPDRAQGCTADTSQPQLPHGSSSWGDRLFTSKYLSGDPGAGLGERHAEDCRLLMGIALVSLFLALWVSIWAKL